MSADGVAPRAPRARAANAAAPLRRRDIYRGATVAGCARRENAFTAILDALRHMYVSEGTRHEAFLEDQLGRLPPLTRTNTIAVISPKGASERRRRRSC
jgi:hypothetical protein